MQTGRTTRLASVPEWLLSASSQAVKMYAAIDVHSDRNGASCPSVARLAELTDQSRRSVQRALSELEECGALVREVRERKDGSQTSNGYWLRRDQTATEMTRGDAENDTPMRARSLARIEVTETSKDVSARSAPKLLTVNGRNLGFDALQRVCQIRDGSPRVREIVPALNGSRTTGAGIREQFWREILAVDADFECEAEEFENALMSAITRRASLYKTVMKGATLTPTALQKWWSDLPGMQQSVTADLQDLVSRLESEGR